MDIIITGGAGFVASHLIDKLLNVTDIETIYLLDNLVRTNSLRNIQHIDSPKIKFIHADVSTFDFNTIPSVSNVKLLFHLAATRINRCAIFNKEGHEYISGGGYNVIDFCSKNKIKLFFASTASVYSKPKTFPIKEDDATSPITIYGSSKLYTENLIRSYNNMYNLNYTINRFFSVYGPRMDSEGAYTEIIYNWLSNIHAGNNEVVVFGNPDEKILDLVYVDDVVNSILLTTFGSNNGTFNVSTETGVTLTELTYAIERALNVKLNVTVKPEFRNDIEVKRIGSIERLRNICKNTPFPNVSLEDGIKNTYKWIQSL